MLLSDRIWAMNLFRDFGECIGRGYAEVWDADLQFFFVS